MLKLKSRKQIPDDELDSFIKLDTDCGKVFYLSKGYVKHRYTNLPIGSK